MAALPLCLNHLLKVIQLSTVTLTINFQHMIWDVECIQATEMTWLGASISFLLPHPFLVLTQTPLHTLTAFHCSNEGFGTCCSLCIRIVYNKEVDIHKSGRESHRKTWCGSSKNASWDCLAMICHKPVFTKAVALDFPLLNKLTSQDSGDV